MEADGHGPAEKADTSQMAVPAGWARRCGHEEIQSPAGPDGGGANWDVALVAEFADTAALARYQVHPAHVEAGAYVRSVTAGGWPSTLSSDAAARVERPCDGRESGGDCFRTGVTVWPLWKVPCESSGVVVPAVVAGGCGGRLAALVKVPPAQWCGASCRCGDRLRFRGVDGCGGAGAKTAERYRPFFQLQCVTWC
jgi:hypothetical protein